MPNGHQSSRRCLRREHFIAVGWSKTRGLVGPLRQQVLALEQQRQQLDQKMPATLVFKELPKPKPAFILKRGEYDQKGDKVERGTPAFLPPQPAGAPADRLGLRGGWWHRNIH